MNAIFIQIRMARTLDRVTGGNLNRWLQRDNLLRLHASGASNNTNSEAEKN